MTITKVAVAVTALSAALFLSACGGAESGTGAASTAPAPPAASAPPGPITAPHNDADIAFAQEMIPHHRQAIMMSQLAETRAGDEVRALARQIEQAQGPEIQEMKAFLRNWDTPEHGDMHGAGGAMAGMMTPQQMQQLERASGEAFDRMFLEMMVAHHEGAVQMAQVELADGRHPEARALAQEIVEAQQSEIERMRALLG